PSLGEDLGAARDGAILAVRPHDASVLLLPCVVKSRFLTGRFAVPGGPMWLSKEEDTMTVPTTAEVRNVSNEPTVVEIDGFRGRLLSAGQADYDIPPAVLTGAHDTATTR